jgi:16S rRNA processing protein RimM
LLESDDVFKPGRRVVLSSPKGSGRETVIEFFRRQHGRCVAKFRGIENISEAEKYIGFEVRIPADSLPKPEEGWFYTFRLKGCRVFTVEGDYIGTITDVLDSGGVEILKVDRENEETLIPFAKSFMKRIDLEQQRIEVDLPEGLLELNK